jgi:hypothetical protein
MGFILDDATLSYFRGIVDSSYPSTCIIYRRSTESNGRGGSQTAYTPDADPVPCRAEADPNRPRVGVPGERERSAADWSVFLPHGRRVSSGDRLLVTAESGDAVGFEVLGDDADLSQAVDNQVLCVRLS